MVTQPAGHRWRPTLQRLMLPGEIIPRYEQSLHGRMVAQALAVAVGEADEPPQAHTDSQIEPLSMRRAVPIFVAITEHGRLFYVGYPGRRVVSDFLGAGVIPYQHGEIHLRLKRKRDIHPIGCEAMYLEMQEYRYETSAGIIGTMLA